MLTGDLFGTRSIAFWSSHSHSSLFSEPSARQESSKRVHDLGGAALRCSQIAAKAGQRPLIYLPADKMESSGSCVPGHFWLCHCAAHPTASGTFHMAGGSLSGRLERASHRPSGDCNRHGCVICSRQTVAETEDTRVSINLYLQAGVDSKG